MSLRWFAGILGGAIALAVASVFFVVATQPGSAWFARELEQFSPGALRIDGVRGSWLAGIRIENIGFRAGHTSIRLRGFHGRLAAPALLRGVLELDPIDIDELSIAVDSDPNDRRPVLLPTITTPVPIHLHRLRVARVELQTPRFSRFVTDVSIDAMLARTRLELRHLHARSGAATVELSGSAELHHPLPLQASLQWSWDHPSLTAAGTVQGDLNLLRLRQTILSPEPVRVQAEVRGLVSSASVDATATWKTLSREVSGLGVVVSQEGRLSVAGAWEKWQGSVASRLAVPRLPNGEAVAAFRGSRDKLTVDDLRIAGAFGQIAGSGAVDLGAGPAFAVDLRMRDIDPSSLRREARGRLSGRVQLKGTVPGELSVEVTGLAGTLMGRPIAGRGSVSYRARAWAFRDIDLSAGPNHLVADGSFRDRAEGRFSLDAPHLEVIWPGLRGSVRGRGEAGGTLERPVGRIDLDGRNLQIGDRLLHELGLKGGIDPHGGLQLNVEARGLVIAERNLGDLHAVGTGLLAKHQLEAKLSGGLVAASMAAQGGWKGGVLHEDISTAVVSVERLGDWRLRPAGAHLDASASRADLGDHCWLQGEATLCFSGVHWSPELVSVSAALRGLPVDGIRNVLPEEWVIAGSASADGTWRLDRSGTQGHLNAEIANAAVYFVGGDEPLVRVFPVAQLSLDLTPAVLLAQAELSGDRGIHLRADGRLEDPLSPSGALGGRVSGEVTDIGDLLPLLIPGNALSDMGGRVTLGGVVGGTRDAPRVTGELVLRNGTVALAGLGVKLEALDLTARGNETATLAIEGSARSGGEVKLSGTVELMGEGAPVGRLRIRGQNLDAVSLPNRYIRASPDITLLYRAGRLSVEGTVEIPKANIVVKEFPTTAVTPSTDAIVHDRPQTGRERPRALTIDGELKLRLGDAVRLKAFGLDTRLEGALNVRQTPDGYAAGDGVVRLEEGKFKAYGKELDIERGNLIFSGPLDNPTLDVRASRRVDYEAQSVTVGLQLSGSAERVESHVFSDPAMGEADALSYLVANRPLAKASASDQSSVASAAISLGIGQTAPITQQLGSAIALDELGFQGSGLQQTEIVAGKQIGSDLYIRFAYGLFNRVGSILARYRIGKRLSIEASSGEQQSLDLVYSIETN